MNVLDIPKQVDKELIYTTHALERAEQRNVPMPKYVPLNVRCSRVEVNENGIICYTLNYDFFGTLYEMVVTEKNVVLTLFTPVFQPAIQKEILQDSWNLPQQYKLMKLKQNKIKNKYSHLEIQAGIDEYYNYA